MITSIAWRYDYEIRPAAVFFNLQHIAGGGAAGRDNTVVQGRAPIGVLFNRQWRYTCVNHATA